MHIFIIVLIKNIILHALKVTGIFKICMNKHKLLALIY